MRLYYLAHCLHPVKGEDWAGNIASAEQYLAALLQAEIPVSAPWLVMTRMPWLDETYVLKICCESVRRHDGLIHVGPRIAPGMQREEAANTSIGHRLYDLTRRPPEEVVSFMKLVLRRDQ